MKTLIKGFEYRFKNLKEAWLLITVDKEALANMPDMSKPTEIEITAKRKQRSLSANAYCWVLCGKIAARIGSDMKSIDIYRAAIRNAADDTMWIPTRVPRKQADMLKASWEGHGDGWIADPIDTGYEPYAEFKCYIGSSVYDTRQMQRLLDELISEAESLGIDSLTPEERERMMSAWGR